LELAHRGQEINKPQDLIKDPWVLEFLDLPEAHQLTETRLEKALIDNLQDFLLECNCSPPIKNIFKKIVKTLDKFFGYRFYFSSIGFKKSLGTI
jgi:sulfur relay (sulfurtransferase) DsrC/TusE family protein